MKHGQIKIISLKFLLCCHLDYSEIGGTTVKVSADYLGSGSSMRSPVPVAMLVLNVIQVLKRCTGR